MSDTWLPIPDDLTPVDPRTINIPSRGQPFAQDLPDDLRAFQIPTVEEFDQTLRTSFSPEALEEFERQVEELAAGSESPDDERARIYNSLMLSMITGHKPEQIYPMHDALVRTWTGNEHESPQSFTQKLADNVKASLIPGRAMPLILRQMFGDESEELESQIREMEAEIPGVDASEVSVNWNPKEALVKLLFPFTRPVLALKNLYTRGFKNARDAIRSGAPGEFVQDAVLEAARIFPMQVQAMLKGGIPGAVIGAGSIAAGGLMAAAAGGPEGAAPFAAAMGPAGKMGFQLGTTGYIGLIESTQSYRQLMQLEWTDAEGNTQKIDKSYAVAASLGVGVVNALIEYVQIRTLMSGIPGAEKLFGKAATRATSAVVADKALARMVLGKLAKGGAKYAGDVASNVAEEMAQEAVTMIFAEITKDINNAVKGTEFADDWKSILPQMLAIGKSTAKGFAVLSVFGNTINTALSLKTTVEGKKNYDASVAKLQESIPNLTATEARDILVMHEQKRQEQTKRTQAMLSEGRVVEAESRRKSQPVQPEVPKTAFREVSLEEFVEVRDQMAPERKPFVTLYSPEELRTEYAGSRYYVSEQHDGLVGYAVSPSGELFNLFNNSGVRGVGQDAISHATQHGATNLFAFDLLEDMYARHGFEVTKREAWNPEYAPENWDYDKHGTPGVVYMDLRAQAERPAEAYRYNTDRPRTMTAPAYAVRTDDGSIYFDPDATSPLDAARNLNIPAHEINSAGIITKTGQFRAYGKQANPFNTPKQKLLGKIKKLQEVNPHITDEQLPYFFGALEARARARGMSLDQMLSEDLAEEMISTAAIDNAMAQASEEYLQADVQDIFWNLAAQEKNPILPPGRGDQNNEELKTRLYERAVTRSTQEIGQALAEGIELDPAIAWYRGAVDDTIKITSDFLPALQDENKALLFKALLAITSAGTPVRDNYNFSVDIFKALLRTGQMPVQETSYNSAFTGERRTVLALVAESGVEEGRIVGGPQLQNVRLNAERLQQLFDKFGWEGTGKWLVTKHSGREILDFFGIQSHSTVTKGGEHYGAEIFGPKLGPYFLNLTGNHELLVADRWFVRTWNRWMGTTYTGRAADRTIQTPRNKTERQLMQGAMEEVARQLTELTGKPWGVDQVQAVLWYLEKALYERAGLTNEKGVSYKEIAHERNRRYQQGRNLSRDEGEGVSVEEGRKEDTERPQEVPQEVDGVPYYLFQVAPVYHGTIADFDQFNTDFVGEGEGAAAFGWGLYFSSKQEVAEWYAAQLAEKHRGQKHLYEATLESENWIEWYEHVKPDTIQRVVGALEGREKSIKYLPERRKVRFWETIDNFRRYGSPSASYHYTGGEMYGALAAALGSDQQASELLRDLGFDGIRYPVNTLTTGEVDYSAGANYVVFDATQAQIDKHVLFSSYKAAVQFMRDGKALIYATRHADLSSLLHEMAHIWRRKITDPAVRAKISEWVGEDPANWGAWSRAAEEKFARGMEQFFAEGKAPTPKLQHVFSAIAKWLKGIVEYVDGLPLPTDVRKAYDALFTPQDPGKLGDTAPVWDLIELERQNRILYDLLPDVAKVDDSRKTAQEIADELQAAFEAQRDLWFANKDERVFVAKVEAQRFQAQIGDVVRKMGHRDVKIMARKFDEAMHVYIDLKRDPNAIDEYYDFLTPYQKEIVDLAGKLPRELQALADQVGEAYLTVGREARDHEILQNLIDNYVSRAWVMKEEGRGAKFRTTTSHAKHRKFNTILEGWANKYELRFKTATIAMREYQNEMIRTIEDKRFIKALAKMRDAEGRALLSDKELEDYGQVEHPNFKLWKYAGTAKVNLLVRSLREYHEKSRETRVGETGEAVTPGSVRKLEEVIVNSLMIRGYTEGEAQNALASVKRAGNKEEVSTVIKEIEKVSKEREHIVAESFKRVFGKNFILTQDGTILERRELYAPQYIAKNLNNILGRSKLMDLPGVKALTKFNAIVKSIILSSSLFHHFAFARSYYLGTNHKTWREMKIWKAWKEGRKAIQALQPEVLLGVRNGLTLGVLQDWDEALVQEATFLDRWFDKTGFAKGLRDGVRNLQKRWADNLFDNFGAGLKAKAFLIEYRNQLKKYPGEDPNVLAKRVANLVNDDFGGLHLGRMGRNPTSQHIFRILMLAPDWTESNFRTVTKAMGFALGDVQGKLSKEERQLYQAFWAKALIKGLAATVFLNFLGAGGDPERFLNNYREALRAGNMRALDIDITWLWKLMGGKGNKRKYFSLIGHFKDPIKWVRYPLKSVRHKGSVASNVAIEGLTGKDWAGRGFTTFGELLGTGKTVAWWPEEKGSTDYSWLPSFIINQLIGFTPIQIQNLVAAISGEQDWFESIGNMVGLGIRSTYK